MVRNWIGAANADFRALLVATVAGGFSHWPDAGAIFADYLEDDDVEVKNYALIGMIELGPKAQQYRDQIGMKLFDTDKKVRLTAIRTVVAIKTNDPSIIGQMKIVASHDVLEEVRNAALFAVNSLP